MQWLYWPTCVNHDDFDAQVPSGHPWTMQPMFCTRSSSNSESRALMELRMQNLQSWCQKMRLPTRRRSRLSWQLVLQSWSFLNKSVPWQVGDFTDVFFFNLEKRIDRPNQQLCAELGSSLCCYSMPPRLGVSYLSFVLDIFSIFSLTKATALSRYGSQSQYVPIATPTTTPTNICHIANSPTQHSSHRQVQVNNLKMESTEFKIGTRNWCDKTWK